MNRWGRNHIIGSILGTLIERTLVPSSMGGISSFEFVKGRYGGFGVEKWIVPTG